MLAVLEDLVAVLSQVFSQFDVLAEQHGLERIKTTGDGYMVASGVPDPRRDHAEVLTRLGLEMCAYFNMQTFAGQRLELRVGINSGPVVAAVIGLQRFSYDVWGDTVNIASRLTTEGMPGMIQVDETTYRHLRERYEFQPPQTLLFKGKGEMRVYRLQGRRETAEQHPEPLPLTPPPRPVPVKAATGHSGAPRAE